MNTRSAISVFVLLLAALLWGCGSGHDARITAVLDRADSLLLTSDAALHDSVRQELERLDTARALRSDEALRARHALLLVQARYKCYATEEADSALIDTAYRYYTDHHSGSADQERYTRTLIYQGAVAEELGHPQQAMQWYLEAEQAADPNDHFNLGFTNLRIANIYQKQNIVDKYLISKYRQSLKQFKQTPYNHYKIVCMTELGGIYRNINLDSAFYFTNQAHDLSLKICDTTMLPAIQSVLCRLLYSKSMFTECKNIALMLIKNKNTATLYDYYYLALSYVKMGVRDSANIIFNQAPLPQDVPDSVLYYDLESEIMRLNEKTKEHISSYKKSVDIADSTILASVGKDGLISLTNQKVSESKKSLSQTKGFQVTIIVLAVLLLLIASCATYFHHKSRCARNTIQSLKSELEFLNVDQELKNIIGDEIQTIQNLLLAYYKKEEKDAVKTMRNLKNIVAINNPSSTFWVNIEHYLNSKYNGIIAQVRKQFPELDSEEIKIISLYCCEMKPTFIMLVMNYTSLQTVYNRKNVISKKMEPKMSMNALIEAVKSMKMGTI